MSSGLPAPANGKWEVRYDPHRMNAIWVRDHFKGRWIEARWIMDRQALAPFSRDVLEAAKKVIERRDGATPGKEVVAQINRILTAPASTVEKVARRRSATSIASIPDAPEQPAEELSEPQEPTLGVVPDRPAAPVDGTTAKRPRRKAKRIDLED